MRFWALESIIVNSVHLMMVFIRQSGALENLLPNSFEYQNSIWPWSKQDFLLVLRTLETRYLLKEYLEDGTWNPGIYFTTTFRLYKMFNREKMLYHPLMSKYAMRHLETGHLATCPAARHRHFLVVSFSFGRWHRGWGGSWFLSPNGQFCWGFSFLGTWTSK